MAVVSGAAALLERQMAVFCPNIGVLSASVLSLIPLMRPFAWQSLLLPVLPVQDKMLDLLEAPVPFILGIRVRCSPLTSEDLLIWESRTCLLTGRRRSGKASHSPMSCFEVPKQPDESRKLQSLGSSFPVSQTSRMTPLELVALHPAVQDGGSGGAVQVADAGEHLQRPLEERSAPARAAQRDQPSECTVAALLGPPFHWS